MKDEKELTNNRPRRIVNAATNQLNANSLIGSYFHGGPNLGLQGVVVGEPMPGTYLVEMFSWISGEPTTQFLVRIEQMMDEEWRFYDDAEWLLWAYEYGGIKEAQERSFRERHPKEMVDDD